MATTMSKRRSGLSVSSILPNGSPETIERWHENRSVDELRCGSVLPKPSKLPAEIQRVFRPHNTSIASPGPFVIVLVRKRSVVAIGHVALLPRPGQMIIDQQMLVWVVSRAEINERETEAAGRNGIHSKFVAKALSINRGRTVQIGQAHCVLAAEIVIEPRLSIGEAEDHGSLVAEIDPIKNVLKVAFANVRQPRSTFICPDGSF